jgi:hypothetical protein
MYMSPIKPRVEHAKNYSDPLHLTYFSTSHTGYLSLTDLYLTPHIGLYLHQLNCLIFTDFVSITLGIRTGSTTTEDFL